MVPAGILRFFDGLSLAISIDMEEDHLIAMAENPRNIVGIYKYCDRWCDRCLFTDRCAQYQTHSNAPDAVEGTREVRVHDHPSVRAATTYRDLVTAWFDTERIDLLARANRLVARADRLDVGNALVAEAVQVKQALQIIAHDCAFIAPQVSRAVRGRARREPRASVVPEPVQSDSNGCAKVALISIDRSEAAWRILAEWMGGSATALLLAETLAQLRTRLELEFPAARQFIRPGFDHTSL
jgi:hypothetical protein